MKTLAFVKLVGYLSTQLASFSRQLNCVDIKVFKGKKVFCLELKGTWVTLERADELLLDIF